MSTLNIPFKKGCFAVYLALLSGVFFVVVPVTISVIVNFGPWAVLGLMGLGASMVVLWHSQRILREGPEFVSYVLPVMGGHVALLIGSFAFLYKSTGLSGPDGPTSDFLDCLYFSASTITTLGLGDFRPSPGARPVVVLEALTGYLVFAILVGAVVSALGSNAHSKYNVLRIDSPDDDR